MLSLVALALVCAGPCVQPVADSASASSAAAEARVGLADLRAGRRPEVAGPRVQLAVRSLVVSPGLRAGALARLASQDRAIISRLVEAGEGLRSLTPPKSSLPRWRIARAPAPGVLRVALTTAGRPEGIDWRVLAGVMLVETRMGRIRGASDAGALGPFQFLPATWRAYGRGDIESYADSARAAARYLRASGAAANLDGALFAYNHDTRYVRAVRTYAELMQAHPWLYRGLYEWRVLYRMRSGTVALAEGFDGRSLVV